MRIREIESQHRRDFRAVYECEACSETTRGSGYDDTHFHQVVIPAMECKGCGKASNDLGEDAARRLAPRYPDHQKL